MIRLTFNQAGELNQRNKLLLLCTSTLTPQGVVSVELVKIEVWVWRNLQLAKIFFIHQVQYTSLVCCASLDSSDIHLQPLRAEDIPQEPSSAHPALYCSVDLLPMKPLQVKPLHHIHLSSAPAQPPHPIHTAQCIPALPCSLLAKQSCTHCWVRETVCWQRDWPQLWLVCSPTVYVRDPNPV